MLAHNISARSAEIASRATHTDNNDTAFASELNKIANTMQQAMLRAESMCSKNPAASYSETMANLNTIIRYWKTKKSAMKTKRDATYQLQQIKQSLPTTAQAKLVKLHSIQTHIRKAISEYNKELPKAKQHRQDQTYE